MTKECKCLKEQLLQEVLGVMREAVKSKGGFVKSCGFRKCPCEECYFAVSRSTFSVIKIPGGGLIPDFDVVSNGQCAKDEIVEQKKSALG